MEVKRRREPSLRLGGSGNKKRSMGKNEKFALSLYIEPPTGELSLSDFEIVATNRLRVLKKIEEIASRNLDNVSARDKILAAERKTEGIHDNTIDLISHFILRLAFCKTEDLRRWFVTQETKLFRARFESESEKAIDEFCHANNLTYEAVSLQELNEPTLRRNLSAIGDIEGQTFYKVPFEDALELVGRRICYLSKGFAYVSRVHLVSIIGMKFKVYLSKQMAATYRSSHHVRKDQRVSPLLNMLGQQHVGPSFKAQFVGNVNITEIPSLAERSFPLCMDHAYTGLMKESHLKHSGRMQLGLFLKGIGLSLEEAMIFWQRAFSKKTDGQKFQKNYAYNIRHNYGKEGARKSYTPYSCIKIIGSAPGAGDHAGCPFRHFDQVNLRVKLRQKRVPNEKADSIIALVQNHHYQIACREYFTVMHNNTEPDEPINHPNSYFNSSHRHWKKEKEAMDAQKTEEPKKIVKEFERPAQTNDATAPAPTSMDTTE